MATAVAVALSFTAVAYGTVSFAQRVLTDDDEENIDIQQQCPQPSAVPHKLLEDCAQLSDCTQPPRTVLKPSTTPNTNPMQPRVQSRLPNRSPGTSVDSVWTPGASPSELVAAAVDTQFRV